MFERLFFIFACNTFQKSMQVPLSLFWLWKIIAKSFKSFIMNSGCTIIIWKLILDKTLAFLHNLFHTGWLIHDEQIFHGPLIYLIRNQYTFFLGVNEEQKLIILITSSPVITQSKHLAWIQINPRGLDRKSDHKYENKDSISRNEESKKGYSVKIGRQSRLLCPWARHLTEWSLPLSG